MSQIFLNYINVSVCLFALITIVEVLIIFKKPFVLKLIIVVSLLTLFLKSGSQLFYGSYNYNRWIRESFGPVLLACMLCFGSFLYKFKIAKNIFLYSICLLVANFFTLFFFPLLSLLMRQKRSLTLPYINLLY
jgi:hypothetical protein